MSACLFAHRLSFTGQFRRVSRLLVLSLAVSLTPAVLHAQDAEPKADVENSKFQFEGVVNSNSVFVHSGASETDYPTMKLDHGTPVTVVGLRFDWLKILPPEGSFCYVAQAYVEKRGDGTVGRTTNTVYVRVGSALNDLKTHPAMKLEAGKDVTIIGEHEEYYKIKPPEGVYLYVNKQYVDPVKQVAIAKPDPVAPPVVTPPTTPPVTPPAVSTDNTLPPPPDTTKADTTKTDAPSTQPVAVAPTTQPEQTAIDAQAEFDKLEATFAIEAGKPLEEQNPAALSASYDKLAKSGQLPDSIRRIADYKAASLKVRGEDREQYLAVKKQQDETKARIAALRAEREELEARVKQTEIKSYAAVGTLRASSLQQGQQTLYRLTDPSTGRTVVYIRTNDSKLGTMMNQFIGVKGDVATDAQLSLKVIEPTAFDTVDQSKLYTSVMSQIVPPSLMPAGTASATGN